MEVTTTMTNVLSRQTTSRKIDGKLIPDCMSIPQLLIEFKALINRQINGIKVLTWREKELYNKLLEECSAWTLDEEENVE